MIHLDLDVRAHEALARYEGGILGFLHRLLGNRAPVAEALEKKFARRLRRRLREEIRRNGLRRAIRLRMSVAVPRPVPPPPVPAVAGAGPVTAAPVRSDWLPRHPLSAFARTPVRPAMVPTKVLAVPAAGTDGCAPAAPRPPATILVPRTGYGIALGLAPVLGFAAGVLLGLGVEEGR